jgi:hypothetical protein
VFVVWVGCATPGSLGVAGEPSAPASAACVADELNVRRAEASIDTPACGEGPACSEACRRGDGLACYARATELEGAGQGSAETAAMHLQACRSGLAIACTNYAASLWAKDGGDVACAKRIFNKTCVAEEPWGCGMLGRIIVEDAAPADRSELAIGRGILERSCKRLGQFPCRVLALEVERGKFGPSDPATVQRLLERACGTGDSEACGHADAESAFHP